ncbi:TrmH family RNA methyltransferase [Solicola sp. PLA-1-18]|uniref:TrmH family RNA methyltransferase n=1 Tax=Solicola sp. PLA-1-18 TaxID=3380532 RepID=UPI003B818DE9
MLDPEDLTPRSGRVRRARRLADTAVRRRVGEFLVEGPQAVREALRRPGTVVEVFATPDATATHTEMVQDAALDGVAWTQVDDDVVRSLTDTVNPQGLVARCGLVTVDLDVVLDARPRLVVVCADVRDPGNAGTVLRCADAAGADAVVLAGHSVDPHNPKAVRASAGSLFHLPVAVAPDVPAALSALRELGLGVLAADGTGDVGLHEPGTDEILARPTAWLLGNEAWGLPDDVRALADHVVAVPIYGRAESLNLATAAAVCLYASARAQRVR